MADKNRKPYLVFVKAKCYPFINGEINMLETGKKYEYIGKNKRA